MPLTPEESKALHTMQKEVHSIYNEFIDFKAKVIQHGVDIKSAHQRLDLHEHRIGTLEMATGVGSLGGRQNPMVDPYAHRARMVPSHPPPRSAEELGLEKSPTGTSWKTRDVQLIVRRFEDQEQQRLGAEQALELERKNFDRKLKNFSVIAGLVVLLVGGAVSVVTYLAVHVSVVAPETPKR